MDTDSPRARRMTRGLGRLACLGLALLLVAGPARGQGYDAGVAAFEAGDFDRALRIWQPLAESGDAIAQYSLGKLYETGGAGVPKDYGRSVEWYRQSAAKGFAAAQNNLGLMHAQGRGVARDPARAAELWHEAGRQSHPMAQFNLGLAFFRGEGVEPNKVQAELWFRRAADLGLAEAQYALGQIKRLGLTAGIDQGEALNWYQLAAAQGHPQAREQAETLRRDGVKPTLPPPLSQVAAQAPAKAAAERPAARPAEEAPALPPAPATARAEGGRTAAKAPAIPESASVPGDTPVMPSKREAGLAPAAATPPADAGDGSFRVWLRSERSEDAAALYLGRLMERYPHVLAQTRGYVEAVDIGKGRKLYRALAGGLPSPGAARALCHSLREEDPGTFCKMLAGRQQAN